MRNVLATPENQKVLYREGFSVYDTNSHIPNSAGDLHITGEVTQADICETIKEAINDGLTVVRQFEGDGKLICWHFQFPIMGQFPSGFPSFRKSFAEDGIPLTYRSVLGRKVSCTRKSASSINLGLPDYVEKILLAR